MSNLELKVETKEAIKYDKLIIPLLIGATLISLMPPFTLSVTISKFEVKATVIQLTAKSDDNIWPLTNELIILLETFKPSGIADKKLLLNIPPRNEAYKTKRIKGVINETKNIDLSLKYTFIFLLVRFKNLFIITPPIHNQ